MLLAIIVNVLPLMTRLSNLTGPPLSVLRCLFIETELQTQGCPQYWLMPDHMPS